MALFSPYLVERQVNKLLTIITLGHQGCPIFARLDSLAQVWLDYSLRLILILFTLLVACQLHVPINAI